MINFMFIFKQLLVPFRTILVRENGALILILTVVGERARALQWQRF